MPRLLPPASLLLALVIASCTSIPRLKQEPAAVVYALGSRTGFTSPLARTLTPACPALTFPTDSHRISGQHHLRLQQLADKIKAEPNRLLIVGYTSPNLPQDYARALSERRAQGVRQHLIELGVEASALHTLGLGNDFSPSAPSSDVVVVYNASATPPPAAAAPAE